MSGKDTNSPRRVLRKGRYRADDVGGLFLRTSSTPRAGSSSSTGGTLSAKAAALQTYFSFFVCGMCLTYPWNAINTAIGALSEALGKQAFVYIQAAYYLPLLPCLLLQTRCDARYDARFGLRAAYGCRFLGTGLGLAMAVGLFLPFGVLGDLTLWQAVAICGCVGIAQSLAFGAACQCAARFNPRAVVVFTCGYQASPCLVLLLTLATGGARLGGRDWASALYWAAASGLAMLGVLVLTSYLCMSSEAAAVLADADARLGVLVGAVGGKTGYVRVNGVAEDDQMGAADGEVEALLSDTDDTDGSDSSSSDLEGRSGSGSRSAAGQGVEEQATWRVVLPVIWPSVAAAYLSFTHGLLVVCLLPYVPAELPAPGGEMLLEGEDDLLAERLVFVNLFANLSGRLLSITGIGVWAGGSPRKVLTLAVIRLLLLAPFAWYIFGGPGTSSPELRNDLVAEAYVALMVVTAGILASVVYSSACAAVPRSQRAVATLLVNLGAFYTYMKILQ